MLHQAITIKNSMTLVHLNLYTKISQYLFHHISSFANISNILKIIHRYHHKMSDTSNQTDTPAVNPEPSQQIPSTPDELAAMEILYKNAKATDNNTTSVAPWLLAEFTTHKNRLIKGQI
jgi:hypothetical protein